MTPEWFARAVAALDAAGVPSPGREARVLLGVAGVPRHMAPWDVSDLAVIAGFEALVARRVRREPLSHLAGYRDFYAHRFYVTPDVLDPRPDTETLVELALQEPFSEVLDLGTGSGCILLSLLAARPGATGCGADLSPAALAVAARNREALGLTNRVILRTSDWFDAIPGTFDLIVSNPPYIAADEMPGLAPEVRDHEPRMALTDEADGLSAYRSIAAGCGAHLRAGGRLLVEIGPTQARAVTALFAVAGLVDIVVHPDLDGRDRVIAGRKSG